MFEVIKKISTYLVLVICFSITGIAVASVKLTAQLEEVPETEYFLEPHVFYRIKLTFDSPIDELTLETLEFDVTSLITDEIIQVSRRVQTATFDKFGAVFLYSQAFRPDVDYVVVTRDNEANLITSPVLALQQVPGTFQALIYSTKLLVEPAIASLDSIGMHYMFDFFAPTATPSLNIKLNSEGDLALGGTEGFVNALEANLSLNYRLQPRIPMNLGVTEAGISDIRSYAYPIVFSVRPIGFEATSNFAKTDFAANVSVVGAVPYSDLPILLLHKGLGVDRSFFPMTLSAGYTLVPSADINDLGMRHRLDGEILYDFPLTNSLDFHGRFRAYVNLEGGPFESLLDMSLKYYFNSEYTSGIEMTYISGSAPPAFSDTTALRLGFSFSKF